MSYIATGLRYNEWNFLQDMVYHPIGSALSLAHGSWPRFHLFLWNVVWSTYVTPKRPRFDIHISAYHNLAVSWALYHIVRKVRYPVLMPHCFSSIEALHSDHCTGSYSQKHCGRDSGWYDCQVALHATRLLKPKQMRDWGAEANQFIDA